MCEEDRLMECTTTTRTSVFFCRSASLNCGKPSAGMWSASNGVLVHYGLPDLLSPHTLFKHCASSGPVITLVWGGRGLERLHTVKLTLI